jgi:Protein of unknown function (DUF3822)
MSIAARNFFDSIGDPDAVIGDGSERLLLSIDQHHIHYFIRSHHSILYYGHYTLHGVGSDEVLSAQLALILTKDVFLQKSYCSIHTIWSSSYTLIPSLYYTPNDYPLDMTHTLLGSIDAQIVYGPSAPIKQQIEAQYPRVVHSHRVGVLIEALAGQVAAVYRLYVHTIGEQVDILYMDLSGKLLFCNTYTYLAPQDYIYYVLLAADELGIDREEVRVTLLGEMSVDSQLYELTGRYFRYVSLAATPTSITFSEAFEEFPRHYLYHLYNS